MPLGEEKGDGIPMQVHSSAKARKSRTKKKKEAIQIRIFKEMGLRYELANQNLKEYLMVKVLAFYLTKKSMCR